MEQRNNLEKIWQRYAEGIQIYKLYVVHTFDVELLILLECPIKVASY
jgi:hypothetical protein